MAELRTEQVSMPVAAVGPPNPLPPLRSTRDVHAEIDTSGVDEEMARNLRYGRVATVLPYLLQDGYTRDRVEAPVKVAMLENDVLRATFLLDHGGRLASLVHRPSGRELLHRNQILQPANLALRNAWFAGGVEWNLGTTGHTALTCSPLHAVRLTTPTGQPVLRMYEFERMRELVYVLDFWLPENSAVLMVHVRVINHDPVEKPVYWWSNISVPETEDVRVVAPADSAYHFGYGRRLEPVGIPVVDGADVTYPARARHAADYFFDTRAARRPFIAALDGQGLGLAHTSTRRLMGRKLFVWGRGVGGRRWQEFLSGPDSAYCEIQAGLARTQAEHLPMPGNTSWSWVEAYGPAEADPAAVHGADWAGARAAAEAAVDRMVPASALDQALRDADAWADEPPLEVLHVGSGWGALEQRRRAVAGAPSMPATGTPFDEAGLGEEQAPWMRLLADGRVAETGPSAPVSYVVGPSWLPLLEAAADSPAAWLHRGVARWHAGTRAEARAAWERAGETPWALRNLAVADAVDGDAAASADRMLTAHRLAPGVRALTLETVRALRTAGRPDDALAILGEYAVTTPLDARLRLEQAWAALEAGDLDLVERLLEEDLAPADLREGELSLGRLWFAFQDARAERRLGRSLTDADREAVRREHPVPARYDFAMSH
ncbi:DUF5107 domain-containing protein [Actinopolymorpha rutila]|uniref:DUF5107 domain-containing protein n=1 Tax=Actinopolymorpha rutila TaxID=446787 RepID=A0A852Z2Y1_9ACTN|nr:DUF5107 domain-containing protein [Actinopolymorpha rutila]NYH87767.1 hypothetical protein [Actinopolymorpha rutila]